MTTDLVLVLSNLPAADADRIATAVVEARLAACVSLSPVRSVYRWQGALERADEVQATCKTTAAGAAALIECLRGLHPYQVPEILVVPVSAGHAPYLAWVEAEVAART